MRIAISGAGVAGPTLAYWLHRTGHQPTLIERAPHFRDGGYAIDFWGAGYRVAQRMGLESAIRDAGYQIETLRSLGPRGDIKASLRVDGFRRATRGQLTTIARGDLASILYAAIRDDVETIFDDSITAISQTHDAVTVSFVQSGTRDFDIVVGADGLHSNVRRLAFGADADTEHYLGALVAVAVVDGYRPRDDLVYVTFSRPGRSIARFSLRGDRTLVLFVLRSPATGDPGTLEGRISLLRAVFGDDGWECRQLLAAVEQVDELYFDVVSQVRMPTWSRDRVVLVGDAAAAVSLLAGEGTSLAMTEAYVLAGELQRAEGDYRRAFAAYEARLRPLIERKQAGAQRLLSVFATKTEFGIWLRHLVMRTMNVRAVSDLIVSRSLRDDVNLPDYPM